MYTLTPANVESALSKVNAFLDYPEQNFARAFGTRRLCIIFVIKFRVQASFGRRKLLLSGRLQSNP